MDRFSAGGRKAANFAFSETGSRHLADCLRWLERAAHSTVNPTIHRLIDDVATELRDLGSIDVEMRAVIEGALESVATALDIDRSLRRMN